MVRGCVFKVEQILSRRSWIIVMRAILMSGVTDMPKPNCQTILCIDDNDSMLEYQRALFERRGFAVLTADSARQGLRLAATCPVAAVIVDYHMPEMNGYEVASEIKRLRPQVPIVMVSSDSEIAEYALSVVDAFVAKDEAPSRLLPVITRICAGRPWEAA
jgi:CheY-like chemotaxis protein